MESQRAGYSIVPLISLSILTALLHVGSAMADDVSKGPGAGDSAQPVYDIPNLPGAALWADSNGLFDRAFNISVLHSASLDRPAVDQFDGQAALAWNERGLFVIANVIEPDAADEDFAAPMGNCPSVELFEAEAVGGKEHWQTAIALGVDPQHPRIRSLKFDSVAQINRQIKESISAIARKTDQGLLVEAVLPWEVLGIKPREEREFGFQIYVNDGHGSQLLWFPAGGADSNSKAMTRIRLAKDAGPAVTAAAQAGYIRLRHTRVSIAATAEFAGKTAKLNVGDAVIAEAKLAAEGRLATAEMLLPMPAHGSLYGPLTVWLDGHPIDPVTLPDAEKLRDQAIADLDLAADSSVFSGTHFPTVDFARPGEADDLLGQYSVHTTYYDVDYNVVTRADRPGRYGAVAEVTSGLAKPIRKYLTLYRQPGDFNWRMLRVSTRLQLPSELGVDEAVAREQSTAEGDFVGAELRYSREHDDSIAVLLAGLSEISPGSPELPRRLGPEGENIAWWYGLRKKIGDLAPYKYLVHLPDLANQQAGAKFPLILFLHGSGERGDDLDLLAVHGPPKILKAEPDWEFGNKFIVVSPQCPAGGLWNPLQLRDLLDEVCAKYPVDADRVYLTGLSMGGFGSWQTAEWFPERFAAVVPICGGGDPADVSRINEIPTWVFHGGRDPTVPIGNAYEMVQAMRNQHGRIRFTVFPEYGHNSWEPAYDDPDLYRWLLTQKRGQPAQPRATTPDTRPAEQ